MGKLRELQKEVKEESEPVPLRAARKEEKERLKKADETRRMLVQKVESTREEEEMPEENKQEPKTSDLDEDEVDWKSQETEQVPQIAPEKFEGDKLEPPEPTLKL